MGFVRCFVFLFSTLVTLSSLAQDVSMKDLTDLNQLRKTFQEDSGKVRILSLLSPT